jgi:phage host-nuclease inhibitor protein Gam
MAKKMRAKKAAAVDVPQTQEAVVVAIAEIGQLQRDRTRIEAAMNDELAVIREKHEAQALPLAERIQQLTNGVQTWCEAHRSDLTQGGKVKTAAFASGEVRWRMTPGKVVLRGIEAVMDALRERGLRNFIRTKEEPNKEAMLADPEGVAGVPGITIAQVEEFEVLPFETELAEAVA